MDDLEKWMIIWFTSHKTFHPFFQLIHAVPQPTSDNLCLCFCVILLLCMHCINVNKVLYFINSV